MLLAVDELDLHVDDRVAEDPTGRHGFLDALLHGRDIGPRDGTTDDLVDELEPASTGHGLDVDDAYAELTVSARLLLVLALDVGRRAVDRLAVRHPHVLGVDVDTELARQLLEGDLKMRLAGSPQDRLVRLLVAIDDERAVFLLQPVERVGQLVLVGLRAGEDGRRQDGRRVRDGLDRHRLALRGQGVTGGGGGQLRDGADVAGGHLGQLLLLLAPKGEQAVKTLVGARARVPQVVVGPNRARQHLEQRDVADVRVGDRLEHESQRLGVRVGLDLDFGVAGRDRDGRPVDRRRADLADEVGEAVDGHVGGGRADGHREHRRGGDAVGQAALELVE